MGKWRGIWCQGEMFGFSSVLSVEGYSRECVPISFYLSFLHPTFFSFPLETLSLARSGLKDRTPASHLWVDRSSNISGSCLVLNILCPVLILFSFSTFHCELIFLNIQTHSFSMNQLVPYLPTIIFSLFCWVISLFLLFSESLTLRKSPLSHPAKQKVTLQQLLLTTKRKNKI